MKKKKNKKKETSKYKFINFIDLKKVKKSKIKCIMKNYFQKVLKNQNWEV